jgi:GDP-4-dehydro-6-deoxy-D-mannose reductase
MHGKKVLITGVTGFIGSHLVDFLNRHYPSCKITGISRDESRCSSSYRCYTVNSLHQNQIMQVIDHVRPDYIFHLAGLVFSYDWDALYNSNVTETINLLDAIKKTGSDTRVVMAGSAAEYGIFPSSMLPIKESYLPNPQSPYGITKLWQTNIGKFYSNENAPVMIARIFNIIGRGTSRQLSTGDFFAQICQIMQGKQEPLILVGNLQLKRDFLDIVDVCSGLIALAIGGKSNEIYNICSGHSKSFRDILDVCLSLSQLNVKIVSDSNKMQNTYAQDICGSNAKIMRVTSWKPVVQLRDSIRNALNLNMAAVDTTE